MATYVQNFALDILKCPPNGAIKSIVYSSPTKLCVVQGSTTEMCIDLKDFSVPISEAQKTSFALSPASTANLPLTQHVVDFCGLGATSGAKYANFFFDYVNGGTAPASNLQYIEWAFLREITTGPLEVMKPTLIDDTGSTAGATNSDTSYGINVSYGIVKIDGKKFGLQSSDAIAIATNGGLKLWSEVDGEILFNTYNSNIPSNKIVAISYAAGTIWIGTEDSGICSITYNDSTINFSTSNSVSSDIISDNITDIFFSDNKVAVATDLGISVLDVTTGIWYNYSRLNVNLISDTAFTTVYLDSPYLIAGSQSGVYVFDMIQNVWSFYNSTVSGWVANNAVNRLISYQQEVFVANTNGITTFSIGATTCTNIPLPVGLASHNTISDLIYVPGGTASDLLLVSSAQGAISEFDVTGATWTFSQIGATSDLLGDGCNRILYDNYIYFTNVSGFGRFDTGDSSVTTLPLATQTSDILFTYPVNGQFPIALNQKIYMVFSKPVNSSVLTNHIQLTDTLTSAPVTYQIASVDSNMYHYIITPDVPFTHSNSYSFKIPQGLTSIDGKYFRQTVNSTFTTYDKNPINGWNVAGKQLTLTGTEEHFVDPIVFRNPQNFTVNVSALIAI